MRYRVTSASSVNTAVKIGISLTPPYRSLGRHMLLAAVIAPIGVSPSFLRLAFRILRVGQRASPFNITCFL